MVARSGAGVRGVARGSRSSRRAQPVATPAHGSVHTHPGGIEMARSDDRRITVTGSQRPEIDLDLLALALAAIVRERMRDAEATEKPDA